MRNLHLIRIIPVLQKLENRTSDKFMAILWNPVGDSKKEHNTGYMKESDYVEKSQKWTRKYWGNCLNNTQTITPHAWKISIYFSWQLYSKPKVKLEDAIISDETKEKLQVLKQNYNDIVSKHDIGLTYLEEMVIKVNPELPPVVTKHIFYL